jgi:HEAT repeat protein
MRVMMLVAVVVGVFAGGYGVLWLQGAGWLPSAPPHRVAAGLITVGGGGDAGGASGRDAAALEELERRLRERLRAPQTRGLEPLAIVIEEAAYERDWDWVELVGEIVRQRGPDWVGQPGAEVAAADDGAEAAPDPAGEILPLVVELRQLERRLALRALANRTNRATALMARTDPQALATLGALLSSAGDEQVQRDAAWLLARSGDERALAALSTALRSPDVTTRRAAAYAFAAQAWLSGANQLAEILAHEGDPTLRMDAAWGLAQYDAMLLGARHPATDALLTALAQDQSAEIRAGIATWLRQADLERADALRRALFDRLTEDQIPLVRRAVAATFAHAAGTTGLGPASRAAALAALESETDAEVAASLLAVLRHGDEQTLAALDGLASSRLAGLAPAALAEARSALRERVEAARGP